MRSAGSKGPVDLVAIRKGEVLMIQCKVGSRPTLQMGQLKALASMYGAKAIWANRKGRKMILQELWLMPKAFLSS